MKSIQTNIEIDASPEKVWSILMDFDKYGEWNPFIQSISGEAKEGGKLMAVLHQIDSKPMTFKPTCLVAEENKEFRWLGKLFFSGLFDGEHFFKIKDIGEGKVKFVHGENFKGILVPFFKKMIDTTTIKSFELMNKALKERAESNL